MTGQPGVTLDMLRPLLREEVSNVWRLWKAGVVCENYARADMPGVVIVFECASLDDAKRIADFPLNRASLIEWEYIALDSAVLPLEFLFEASVDVAEPYDRTPND